MSSLCLKCGEWKQVPMSRCACGFRPDAPLDLAKCFLLSGQFRTPQELDELARMIRSGQTVAFGEDELRVAMTIGRWNAAVTLSFLGFAILLGLLLGGAFAGLSFYAAAIIAGLTAIAGVAAFKLMAYVDRRTTLARARSSRT